MYHNVPELEVVGNWKPSAVGRGEASIVTVRPLHGRATRISRLRQLLKKNVELQNMLRNAGVLRDRLTSFLCLG